MTTPAPIDPAWLTSFLESLDAAGETLRELVEEPLDPASTALRVYLDGASFLEAGYLMVEQLAPEHPAVFHALHEHHYGPALAGVLKGRIGWPEALAALPEFLRDYAAERAATELEGEV